MAPRNFTDEQEVEIAQRYRNGESAKSIARSFGLKHHISITSALARQNTPIRSAAEQSRKYTFRPDVFTVIDEPTAYWLGFMYADGCIHNRSLMISLSSKDKLHLDRFCEFMGTNYVVGVRDNYADKKRYETATFVITDEVLTNRLKSLGWKQAQKSWDAIPDDMKWHWVRGFFDGDGTASQHGEIGFCKDQEIIKIVHKFIGDIIDFYPTQSKHITAPVWYIRYSARRTRKIAELMYAGATIWLARKRDRIESWSEPTPNPRDKTTGRYLAPDGVARRNRTKRNAPVQMVGT